MMLIESSFRLFAFVTLMSTPVGSGASTDTVTVKSDESLGPLMMRWGLDYVVRVLLLFTVGLCFEYALGNELYESYLIDYMLLLIAVLGAVHWLIYVLLLVIGPEGRFRFCFYRILRNLCFAPIPGLFLLLPINLWEYFDGLEAYESGLALLVYKATTVLAIVIGLAEALLRKRRPTGFAKG